MTDPISNTQAHLGYWLRFVSNHVSQGFARRLAIHDVTVAEWVVLRDLFDHRSSPPSQIADRLGLTRGAITKLADRLLAKHLISRLIDDHDRRRQTLSLTATGRALVPELASLADANDTEFFGHLSSVKQQALTDAMKALIRHHDLRSVPID